MMKENNFIYKLLLFIQVWLCSILITHLLVKYNVLTFSHTKSIFLFQFGSYHQYLYQDDNF